MAWHQVCTGQDMDDLAANVPEKYQYVPVGKRTRIKMNTSPFPVAPLFDLAGAEFAARLLQRNGKLIDVSGEGLFTIVFEIESVDNAQVSMESPELAEMHLVMAAVLPWLALIAGLLVVIAIVPKLSSMFANFVPSSGGGGSSGGIIDYFKTLFGDWTPYVAIGAGVVLIYLLMGSRRGGGSGAPIVYNIEGSRRKS